MAGFFVCHPRKNKKKLILDVDFTEDPAHGVILQGYSRIIWDKKG